MIRESFSGKENLTSKKVGFSSPRGKKIGSRGNWYTDRENYLKEGESLIRVERVIGGRGSGPGPKKGRGKDQGGGRALFSPQRKIHMKIDVQMFTLQIMRGGEKENQRNERSNATGRYWGKSF